MEQGPGGAYQWRNPRNGLLMLTTDLALIYDDDFYKIVVNFANDLDALDRQFAAIWDKLTTSGGVIAENGFCIDATELDLDLDAMPRRKNDYGKRGRRGNKEAMKEVPKVKINKKRVIQHNPNQRMRFHLMMNIYQKQVLNIVITLCIL